MITADVMQKLETLAQEVATREGCELYDIELSGGSGRRTLRVFIDKTPGGAGIEDCSNVSRGLSAALDVDDPIQGAYDLEVSTPGLERPLRKPWHFSRVVGKKIWLRTSKPFAEFGVQAVKNQPLKQASEVLTAADETSISFEIESETVRVPLSALEKAKLIFEMEKKGPPKKNDKKKK